jgi:ubiquinol-cytochrome c reductase cytochrome c subunit
MKTLLLFAITLAACGKEVDTSSGPDAPAAIDGQAEFAENCSKCHGQDGKGTTDGPQILSPVKAYATYIVRHGRGREMGFPTGMDPFDTTALSDEQLTAILDWLGSAPKPTAPAELYGRFCQNCHGANGRTGRVGKNIVGEVSNLSRIVRQGHGGTNYAARTDYMPAFGTDMLTDADLTTLRTYVSGL